MKVMNKDLRKKVSDEVDYFLVDFKNLIIDKVVKEIVEERDKVKSEKDIKKNEFKSLEDFIYLRVEEIIIFEEVSFKEILKVYRGVKGEYKGVNNKVKNKKRW